MTTIALWPNGIPDDVKAFADAPDEVPHLVPYIVTGSAPTACVVVCPGGGYQMRAEHEGAPIAEWLNSLGVSAVVLHYRVKRRFPCSLRDAERAIRMVRARAQEWAIRPDQIGILGFSAGGHLAASACTISGQAEANASDLLDRLSPKPDFGILCYPVISAYDGRHNGSISVLLGEVPWDDHLRQLVSLEQQVNEQTPPCFVWHTADDGAVPVSNSLGFASACAQHRVPFALHVFPHGKHGLGLAQNDPVVGQWPTLCAAWLTERGYRS